MNLCLNAFVIQLPDGLLDTCLVTAARALLLPYAHRGHCKDEDSYKEYWSHVEFSISLTRHKISDRAGERGWPHAGRTNYAKATHRSGRGSLHRMVRLPVKKVTFIVSSLSCSEERD